MYVYIEDVDYVYNLYVEYNIINEADNNTIPSDVATELSTYLCNFVE
jgi:pyrrolidone-carboxylate peptidase